MSRRSSRFPKVAVTLAAMALTFAQPGAAQGPARSVFSTVLNDPRFTTTMQMLYLTGYVNVGSGQAVMTVFAPVDAAWTGGRYDGMMSSNTGTSADTEFSDPTEVTKILRGLAVQGAYPAPGAASGAVNLTSVGGGAITLNVAAKTVSWIGRSGQHETAHFAGDPIAARNGIVYPVDAVVGQ